MSAPATSAASFAALVLAAVLGACSGAPGSPPPAAGSPPASSPPTSTTPAATATPANAPTSPADEIEVVTSTTVLADLVRNVGGERVSVTALIPAGRDAHTYEPSPSDAQVLADADMLVINGLGLDEWMEDLAVDAGEDVPLIALGENLDGVEYIAGHDADDDGHDADDEHGHGVNPHLWLDVANARRYVDRLAAALAAHDEAGAADYRANAAVYDSRLADLETSIRDGIGRLPPERRRVVSFHDAFPYFARAYGIEIVGVVVEAPGQEPSASQLASLVTAIREAGVSAVLTEVQFSDRLAQVLVEETGVALIEGLYTDSLGDPPLDTYEAAMRHNLDLILAGLR